MQVSVENISGLVGSLCEVQRNTGRMLFIKIPVFRDAAYRLGC